MAAVECDLAEDFHSTTGADRLYGGKSTDIKPSELRAELRPPDWLSNWQRTGLYLVLALLTWAVFGQTLGHEFVNYDDQNYVYENTRIVSGLTKDGIIAAFTHRHAQNWHPLTTISHMLDCQLFGLNPAGHHLVNVLLHATAVLLLFSILNAMTGAMWRSAFVAAVFAVHPLRVESVAWVSERKDVLSGVFFMLTIAAYVRYVRDRSLNRYLVTALFFVLGLMAKPTVVTLPLLLLLLDYWPLGRISDKERGIAIVRSRPFVEKIPLLLLSLGSAVITIVAQRQTVGYGQSLPLTGRLSNAVVSYVTYIGQMIWPAKLAVFYPDTGGRLSLLTLSFFALLFVGATALVFWMRRKWPSLWVGWCWYLIALLPVIGIVQVGIQGRADRYTYLPQIGLYIASAWGLSELFGATFRSWHRPITSAAAIAVIGLLAWRGAVQTSFWSNTESLWNHALAVTNHNDVAHNNIASLLVERGRLDEAISHYTAALLAGSRAETHNHLSPAFIENSLGNALAKKGELNSALVHYRKAVELRPDFSDARSNLSVMLLRTGDLPKAITEYERVVVTPPEDGISHQRLAWLLVKANRPREAVVHYRRTVELSPNSVDALNALAWILATSNDPAVRNGTDAMALAQRANHLTGQKDPVVLRIVAASCAGLGRFTEATTTAERALSLVPNERPLACSLEDEINLYRSLAVQMTTARSGSSSN